MLFRQLFDQETGTYTYLIADPTAKEAVLVDPVLEQVERDLKLLRELDLTLKFCLETHIHADHITGTGKLRELTSCEGIVPENAHATCANRFVKHEEVLNVGEIKIRAISTSGHTDSHMSFLVNGTHLLTGDALLIRGCGRTDFQSGDAGTLYDHVTQRLFTLPEATLVYPGHDYRGFIGRDRSQFIEFMGSLNLPNPKKIAEAVPANERCGKVALAV
jgi:sulfur dioxygenase